MPFHLL